MPARDESAPEGGLLIAKIHQVAGRVFARLLREDGGFPLNPAQGRILFALWRAPGPLAMRELARETGLGASTLTSMLDRLEAAGHLRRVPDPADRRVTRVERGDADPALERRYQALSGRMNGLFYAGLTRREIEVFERTLARVLGNLEDAERG